MCLMKDVKGYFTCAHLVVHYVNVNIPLMHGLY